MRRIRLAAALAPALAACQGKSPDQPATLKIASQKGGAIAFWDNRAGVHYAVRNYGDYPRVLERILIADEPQWADL